MTEVEWLTAIDPIPMLEFLKGKTSDRKLRLLGIALARASWSRLEDERSRRAIEAAERFADGMIDATAMEPVVDGAWDVRDELWDAGPESHDDRLWLAEAAALTASIYEWSITFDRPGSQAADYPFWPISPTHCELIRDIFGNPFRPIAVDPSWLSSAAIAHGIYDDKAFDRLAILADALQDAGCENADILSHCRSDGPHVRGCWVVDLVLGKE
ncbi:hypothetical protein [Limnoglobus roseus]|uniref:SMI1/KNR4 family protein n=1 Tax=Limnoglobus roseus TaxID=2598579 RepID=A0A5C1AEP5_9BACT|nr:hypothetical protein [Limnoglobus roseus]QEL16162.1 SMI1/KNR4 family protein [Limnoglobus roseus]